MTNGMSSMEQRRLSEDNVTPWYGAIAFGVFAAFLGWFATHRIRSYLSRRALAQEVLLHGVEVDAKVTHRWQQKVNKGKLRSYFIQLQYEMTCDNEDYVRVDTGDIRTTAATYERCTVDSTVKTLVPSDDETFPMVRCEAEERAAQGVFCGGPQPCSWILFTLAFVIGVVTPIILLVGEGAWAALAATVGVYLVFGPLVGCFTGNIRWGPCRTDKEADVETLKSAAAEDEAPEVEG